VEDGATSQLIIDFYKAFAKTHDAAEALAQTQSNWLKQVRVQKGLAEACRTPGPFVLSFRGRLSPEGDAPELSQISPQR